MSALGSAAQAWEAAADHEVAMATLNAGNGSQATNLHNESLYRAVAKSLRMEEEVGEPICHRCFRPYSSSVYTRQNGDSTHECAAH